LLLPKWYFFPLYYLLALPNCSRMQLNCQYSRKRNVQCLSVKRRLWTPDRNSDRQWQATNVWIRGVDRNISRSFLLYLPESDFNRFKSGFKTTSLLNGQPWKKWFLNDLLHLVPWKVLLMVPLIESKSSIRNLIN